MEQVVITVVPTAMEPVVEGTFVEVKSSILPMSSSSLSSTVEISRSISNLNSKYRSFVTYQNFKNKIFFHADSLLETRKYNKRLFFVSEIMIKVDFETNPL